MTISPSPTPELLARIEALARHPAPEEQVTRYSVGDLSLDCLSHKVTRAGEFILLQRASYEQTGLSFGKAKSAGYFDVLAACALARSALPR